MSYLHCDRCGTLFETDGRFTTVDVDVAGRASRETVSQVLLCEVCTDEVADRLILETTEHTHDTG